MKSYSFSFHAAQPTKHARFFAKGWEATFTDQMEFYITNMCWSPCVWEKGIRLKQNFLGTELLVLDIDKDWRIEDAIDYVKQAEAWCLIGTTKSHTDEQHRFRLIMRWRKRITDVSLYEHNLDRFIATTPADRACRDGARFFYPCREIVYAQDGLSIPVLDIPPRKPVPSQPHFKMDRVPPWMQEELRAGVPEGRRNRTTFRFALHLKQRGVLQNEAEQILAPIVSPGFTKTELDKAVWSAWRYNRGQNG